MSAFLIKIVIKYYPLILFSMGFLSCKRHEKNEKIVPHLKNFDFIEKVDCSSSKQFIVAYNNTYKSYKGTLFGVEINNDNWKITFDTIACVFGKSGIAMEGMKIEGDGKTPSGEFEVGPAFGYENNINC